MSNEQKIQMRAVYADTVEELFKQDDNVFCLEADLSSSMSTTKLRQSMGINYVNLGIMEANMIGVASGINVAGGYAYVHSFGQFIARRAMDQVFISLAYAKLDACLVGSDSGVTAEHNGGTHMTFEDMAILRVIPNITIYDTCDPNQFKKLLKIAYEKRGLTYIRTARKEVEKEIYDANVDFEDGANILKEGKDVTILACGIEVQEALKAYEILKEKGIQAEIIDVYQIKPLNEKVILSSAKKTNRVITCENHSVIGGLGSAVSELLCEKQPTKIKKIGVQDLFGQVGQLDYLKKYYKLTSQDIVEAVEEIL